MDKKLIDKFLNQYVGVTLRENNRDFYRKGTITQIEETAFILSDGKRETIISFEGVIEIRKLGWKND